MLEMLAKRGVSSLAELIHFPRSELNTVFRATRQPQKKFHELSRVLDNMPRVNVEVAASGVRRGKQAQLFVTLRQQNRVRKTIHAPKWSRATSEGWFLVLGCKATGEVLALKRVRSLGRASRRHCMRFAAPEDAGPVTYTVYLISDCYQGLDQEYDATITVQP